MKATGIVRKVDELGRIVIPKEIRKNLKIREGEPLEIFTERNGAIVFKKYAPMGDMLEVAAQYVEILEKTSGLTACITDTETVIAISGKNKKEYLSRSISRYLYEAIHERKIISTIADKSKSILHGEKATKYHAQVIVPIISDGDVIGSVILFSTELNTEITNVEYKLAESAANILGKQMES